MRYLLVTAFSFIVSACTKDRPVECRVNSDCDIGAQGECIDIPNSRKWCAYSDPTCPGSMQRYSDYDIDDGLSGTCVDPRPAIVARVPPLGATNVSISTNVIVTLSEPVRFDETHGAMKVTALGSEVDGDTSYNSDTKSIIFHPRSPLSLAVRYTVKITEGLSDNQGRTLGSHESWEFTTTDGVWGTPIEVVSNLERGSLALDPQLATDPQGNAVAIWQDQQHLLGVRGFFAGAGWGERIFIRGSASTIATGLGVSPFLIWSEFSDIDHNRHIMATDGTLSGRALERSELANLGNANPPLNLSIASDSGGHAIAAWIRVDRDAGQIWSSRYDASKWSTAQPMTMTGREVYNLNVALHAQAGGMAIWSQCRTAPDEPLFCVGHGMVASKWDPARGWLDAVPIDENEVDSFAEPQVMFDDAGNLTAIWTTGNRQTETHIWSNRYSDGRWQGAKRIDVGDTKEARDPRMIIDKLGNISVIWRQLHEYHYDLWTRRFDVRSGWSAGMLLEDDEVGSAMYPSIAGDAAGNVIVSWTKNYPSFDGRKYLDLLFIRRFIAHTGWQQPVQVTAFDEPSGAVVSAVGMGTSGKALLIWTGMPVPGSTTTIWSKTFH